MSIASNDSPSAEEFARAVYTASTPINLSVNNASALNTASPIQRLPRELCSEIFLYCSVPPECGTMCIHDGCWPLLSVCRYWHEIVTTTPSLWRRIHIWFGALINCRDPVAGLSLALSRAGDLDLYIYFDGGSVKDREGNDAGDISELALTVLEVLMHCSVQWRIIELIDIDADCMSALDGVSDRLPRLLEAFIRPQPEAGDTLTLGYIPAPLLKSLFFLFSDDSEGLMACCPLQSQLTQFKVRGTQYESSLVDVLRDCRDLKVLELKFSLPSPRVEKRITSQITDLTFQGFFSDLALVYLPQLCELSIGDVDGESFDIILPALLELIKHSRCPLENLSLINCDLAGLGAVLELTPHLHNLAVVFGEFLTTSPEFVAGIDQALLSFMPDLAKEALVPNLQRLMLVFDVEIDNLSSELTFFNDEEVNAIVQRRSQMNAYGCFSLEGCCIRVGGWV